MTESIKKERNIGIDILKFIAVLLIKNTHSGIMYGEYKALAFGGALGNALFFFCSGFTLFMKPINSICVFPNWYKRRINRIYPTVFAIAIIGCTFFDRHSDINSIIIHGGGWFVACIMIYYVLIYMIGLYLRDYINWIMVLVSVVSIIWLFMIKRPFPFDPFAVEYWKWVMYFIFLLMGAKLGEKGVLTQTNSVKNFCFALLGIILFYALVYVGRKVESVAYLSVFSFIPLFFSVYYLYQWSNGQTAKKIYNNKVGYFVIRLIGGLCLEVYLIQFFFFTDKLNNIFPLNILIIFGIIVIAAYFARCLSRFISQTFKDNPYEWKKIIDIY